MEPEPDAFDATLGQTHRLPTDGSVLGGIEGVRQRLWGDRLDGQRAALQATIALGDAGLNLAIAALGHPAWQIRAAAYGLLSGRDEPKAKAAIARYGTAVEVVRLDAKAQPSQRITARVPTWLETLDDRVALEMAIVPGGGFLMGTLEPTQGIVGTENPQHWVSVASFGLSRFPITQAQWEVVAGWPPVRRSLPSTPSFFRGDRLPVESVSWLEAVEFCNRLSQRTERAYRLPSEAEWEYACRARTKTAFHFGETLSPAVANYNGHLAGEEGEYRGRTTPVDTFRVANGFGLADMHGNVWEWCADLWHPDYRNAPIDGCARVAGRHPELRVLRGGAWYLHPRFCRAAARFCAADTWRKHYAGLRVACALPLS